MPIPLEIYPLDTTDYGPGLNLGEANSLKIPTSLSLAQINVVTSGAPPATDVSSGMLLRLQSANMVQSGAVTVSFLIGQILSIGNFNGGGFGGIDFGKPFAIRFTVGTNADYDTTRQSWAMVFSTAAGTAGIASMTPNVGAVYYVAVVCTNGNITLQAYDGAVKTTSAVLAVHPTASVQANRFVLVNNGLGKVFLFKDGEYLDGIAGAPVGQRATAQNKLFFIAQSNANSVSGDHVIALANIELNWRTI